MNKNLTGKKKSIVIFFIAIVGITVTLSTGVLNNRGVEATSNPKVVEVNEQPAHPFIYKIGEESDTNSSIKNHEVISSRQRLARKETIEARKAEKQAEELAKVEAEKEAERKAAEEQEVLKQTEVAAQAKQVTENESSNENKKVQPTQSSASSKTSIQTTNNETKSPSDSKQAAVHKAPAKKAAQPKATPAPKQTSIGSNKIGINGTFKSYTNYGRASTDQLQTGIDSGLIVAGLTSFNGNDGATTYFGGHNPGIMKFIANAISIGSTMTITDSSGQAHQYKMIDKVDVDEYGEGMLSSIGMSAIEAYMYGTGTESILVQFCNTDNNLMSFWYGVKI